MHCHHRGSMLAAGLPLLILSLLAASRDLNGPAATPVTQSSEKGVIVLFGGKSDDVRQNWVRRSSTEPAAWPVSEGAMTASRGDIMTRQTFGDFQLHVEFKVPYRPQAHGQGRGNSGVFLQGRYEIQILDSYGKADPGTGDCGAVYGQAAPLVNACKPPLEWQSYDAAFRAPHVDAATGQVTERARVTVLQNGIVVQNNQEITGPTGQPRDRLVAEPGPILLQYHGNPVEFRNIWVRPLPPHGAAHY